MMGQQISIGSGQKWFAGLYFLACGILSCVTDPNHQAPPKVAGPSRTTEATHKILGLVGTSFDVLYMGQKMILRPTFQPKNLNSDGPSMIFIGTPFKEGAQLLEHLFLDQERTGEDTYRFIAHTDPTTDWKERSKSNLGGTFLGDLWRGNPAGGGTLIIKSLGFSQLSLHKTATKRPIPDHLRDKVYCLVSTDRDMVAIPLFGHSENHATSLRVRLRELRGDPTTQKWLVEEPQLVVFQTSPEISSKDADQTLFLQAKIRIRGKFYASTFELISLP